MAEVLVGISVGDFLLRNMQDGGAAKSLGGCELLWDVGGSLLIVVGVVVVVFATVVVMFLWLVVGSWWLLVVVVDSCWLLVVGCWVRGQFPAFPCGLSHPDCWGSQSLEVVVNRQHFRSGTSPVS